MAATVKPMGPVANVLNTAANNFNNATMVMLYHNTSAEATVFRNDAGGSLIGSVVLPPNTYLILEKEQTDTINASANTVRGSKVGATN
jgi:hypothetical protein